MNNADTPMMASSAYASSAYWGNDMTAPWENPLQTANAVDPMAQTRRIQVLSATPQQPKPDFLVGAYMSERRVVQVFIADPNENIPLEDCLIHEGSKKLTDATDQELFFELDIKGMLEKHNLKRTKVVDKKVKDRTEYLEPAKVRDLKMVVVTVAKL
jgi:hypothetical protein